MPIDTTNKKLALMEEEVWEPGLPINPGVFGQDDLQQLLWGYPGILWAAAAALAFVLDMNTRMRVYLADLYGMAGADLSTLTARRMAALTGEATARFQRIQSDATDAMS